MSERSEHELARWCAEQMRAYDWGQLSAEKIKLMNEIPGWDFNSAELRQSLGLAGGHRSRRRHR